MSTIIEALTDRTVGVIESVHANGIKVLVNYTAPDSVVINSGMPRGFLRINDYLLIPNESGATIGMITDVRIERIQYPKQRSIRDSGLIDLPWPARIVTIIPLGTLFSIPHDSIEDIRYYVRRGVDTFPTVGSPVFLPSPDQLRALVEGESDESFGRVHIGICPTANGAPVYINPDKLFGRHLAVLGNTGAGKSCTVAGLIRWSLDAAQNKLNDQDSNPNARFIILDPNGEYAQAFQDLKPRVFTVDDTDSKLKVPAWLWNAEEWGAFTDAKPGVQRPVLFEALRMLKSDMEEPDEFLAEVRGRVRRYRSALKVMKNSEEHMKMGKREGFAQFLVNISIDFNDLASKADEQLKYKLQDIANSSSELEKSTRGQLKEEAESFTTKTNSNDKCSSFWHNNFLESEITKIIDKFKDVTELVGLSDDDSNYCENLPIQFDVGELPDFVEVIATTQSRRDISQFAELLNLRIRGLFSSGPLKSITVPDLSTSITLDEWLNSYIGNDSAKNGQIAILDLSLVPSESLHVLVSAFARMTLESIQRHRKLKGNELPTVLVLDEAHTFIHNRLSSETSTTAGKLCYQTFERIAREGRKFGLGLVIASQRPSEISPTILSQCNTFLGLPFFKWVKHEKEGKRSV
ncbi:MAG: DUF87 domain-containing protein, partial [Bacteroidetes bacterium]|nr:DUF87 domain-containing protein [Bacteroidota bacterium]